MLRKQGRKLMLTYSSFLINKQLATPYRYISSLTNIRNQYFWQKQQQVHYPSKLSPCFVLSNKRVFIIPNKFEWLLGLLKARHRHRQRQYANWSSQLVEWRCIWRQESNQILYWSRFSEYEKHWMNWSMLWKTLERRNGTGFEVISKSINYAMSMEIGHIGRVRNEWAFLWRISTHSYACVSHPIMCKQTVDWLTYCMSYGWDLTKKELSGWAEPSRAESIYLWKIDSSIELITCYPIMIPLRIILMIRIK